MKELPKGREPGWVANSPVVRGHHTAAESFLVVAYDIEDDRRRTRLHELLKDYGVPVQYSVFECTLSAVRLVEMKSRARMLIVSPKDRLRVYRLCPRCEGRTEAVPVPGGQRDPAVTVV